MSNTYRKDRNDKVFKESLKKKDSDAHYRCRCEYCLGRKDTLDKIAEKELKQHFKTEKCKTYIPTTKTSNRCSICGELKYSHE